MAITTLDDLKAASDGPPILTSKVASTNTWVALFYSGVLPAAGVPSAAGAAGENPAANVAGAILRPDAGIGESTWLTTMISESQGNGFVSLYDRWWHNNLSVTDTTTQTVNSVALPSRAGMGVGGEIWLDNQTAVGASAGTVSVSYTNTDGVAGRTASPVASIAGSIGRTSQFALGPGDIGVQSIQSFIQSTSRTSGIHGLVIRKRLATVPLNAGAVTRLTALSTALPLIDANACLELVVYAPTAITWMPVQLIFAQG